MRTIQSAFGASALFLISACGGGGGGSSASTTLPAASPSPAPVSTSSPTPAPTPSPAPSPAPIPAPVPIPVPMPSATGDWKPTWGDAATAKLKPGVWMGSPDCTIGFLFVDPGKQTYYAATAAHCTSSADGTTLDGTGTRASTKDLGEIGTVVYDSDGPIPVATGANPLQTPTPVVDFTLIQLDAGVNLKANPTVMSYQGPTGYLACADLQAGNTVGFFGQGDGFREAGQQARTGAVYKCNADNTAFILIRSVGGDSGGPMLQLANNKAIGHCSGGTTPTDMSVIPMDLVFTELAKAGFGNVALATIDGNFVRPK